MTTPSCPFERNLPDARVWKPAVIEHHMPRRAGRYDFFTRSESTEIAQWVLSVIRGFVD